MLIMNRFPRLSARSMPSSPLLYASIGTFFKWRRTLEEFVVAMTKQCMHARAPHPFPCMPPPLLCESQSDADAISMTMPTMRPQMPTVTSRTSHDLMSADASSHMRSITLMPPEAHEKGLKDAKSIIQLNRLARRLTGCRSAKIVPHTKNLESRS